MQYTLIEDPKEIRHLNDRLASLLKQALRHAETRTIGYPRGTFDATVRFRSKTGSDVFYWNGGLSDGNRKARNFLGHGTPGGAQALTIDVQFNLPMATFSRAYGGVFLRDVSGNIILGHRGIVTLGHGRVPKDRIFSTMFATIDEASTSKGIEDFLLIGNLESKTLVDDLDSFSSELRRAARSIKAASSSANSRSAPGNLSQKLRHYFDEHSGKKLLPARSESVADCYHGTVVRAIRDTFREAETLKSQAIDLTVVAGNRVYLFEVKTSSAPQYIYTAIGQLTAHAPIVEQYAPGKTLVRVIVLPELPNKRLRDILEDKLDIRLLTFTRSANGRIAMHGLKQLVK